MASVVNEIVKNIQIMPPESRTREKLEEYIHSVVMKQPAEQHDAIRKEIEARMLEIQPFLTLSLNDYYTILYYKIHQIPYENRTEDILVEWLADELQSCKEDFRQHSMIHMLHDSPGFTIERCL